MIIKPDGATGLILKPGEAQEISVSDSALAALIYADLFDYPLRAHEITKYQVGTDFTSTELSRALSEDSSVSDLTVEQQGYFCLRGREQVFSMRMEREAASRALWRRARIYSSAIGRLPFVRMVTVTGALAVDNIAERPDIDLLVVARAGRVWICRRSLILLVRLARFFGDDLCPNYVVSDTNLDLRQRDFFTAHELAQMVPLFGISVYKRMLAANGWAKRYLPCAFGAATFPRRLNWASPKKRSGLATRAIEGLLSMKAFDAWERWELRRMRARLRPILGTTAEVICAPTQCKGHTGLHRQSVMARYRSRLREFNLEERFAHLLGAVPDADGKLA